MTNPDISQNYSDAFLSNRVYLDKNLPDLYEGMKISDAFGNEFVVKKVSPATSSGYQAYAFEDSKTGNIIIANRGTEFFTKDLIVTDAGIGLDIASAQFSEALAFTNSVAAQIQQTNPDFTVSQIHQTGHSLGGGIAVLTAVATGSTATTFNAPIVSHLIDDLKEQNPTSFLVDTSDLNAFQNKITEIVEKDEIVHNIVPYGQHLGSVVTVDTPSMIESYTKDSLILRALASNPFLASAKAAFTSVESHSMHYLLDLSLSQKTGDTTALAESAQSYANAVNSISNDTSPISFACQLDANNNLTIKLSGGSVFENLSLSNFLEDVGTNLAQELGETLKKTIEKNGGQWFDQFITAKPVFVIGIGFDYFFNLREEQRLHGDQGVRDNLVAASQTLAGFLFGAAVTALLIPAGAGIAVTLAAGLAVGILTDTYFDANFFDDGTSSAKDKLGNMIREFDVDKFQDDLFTVGEFGVESAKDVLGNLLDDAHSISTAFQSSLNLLLQSQHPAPPRRVDPLTLDLDGDGVELINVAGSSAFFDLDVVANTDANGNFDGTYTSDGQKEQVGWISGDDGILTLDKNSNGTIDNILELFGKTNKTGTEELREYDLNNDGKIDANDAIFSQLKLWQDVNGNGTSEAGELRILSDYGITSIDVSPESLTQVNTNISGNIITSTGTYTQDSQTKIYANLDLAVNQSNSVSYSYTDQDGNVIGDYNLNLDVLSLPMMRGYGNVEALPIAASKNEALLNALKDLRDLKDLSVVNAKIESVLFNWAGTQDITGMRGAFDARKLATLEEMRGEDYVYKQSSSDVSADRLGLVEAAWTTFFNDVKVKFLAQSTFRDIFSYSVTTEIPESIQTITTTTIDPVTQEEITTTQDVVIPASTSTESFSPIYDFATDKLDLNSITLDQVFANIAAKINSITNNDSNAVDPIIAQQINNAYAAVEKCNFVNQLQLTLDLMFGSVVGMDRDAFNDKFTNIRNTYFSNISTDFELSPVGGAGGNDPQNPNGITAGNKGDDMLLGAGAGDDIYVFNRGDGKDTIDESGKRGSFRDESEYSVDNGNDTILMGKGITKDDVYISGDPGRQLVKFKSTPADQITLDYQEFTANRIERILFSNGDVLDLTDPNMKFGFYGTDGADSLLGYGKNDILDGGKGNDVLQGQRGDDDYVYARGDGTDVISEYGLRGNYVNKYDAGYVDYSVPGASHDSGLDLGNDTIQFAAGITEDDLIFFMNSVDLHIQIKGSPDDIIVIRHQFYGTANRIENLKFTVPSLDENGNPRVDENGKALTEEKIVSLRDKDWTTVDMRTDGTSGNDNITAGAWQYGKSAIINAGAGDDSINAVVGFSRLEINGEGGNDTIGGSNSDDLINGGTGDDVLGGGNGADTYIFNLGDGKDTISDIFSWENLNNKISFGVGISAGDLVLTRSAITTYENRFDLVVNFKNSPDDQITIKSQLVGLGGIKYFEFSTQNEDGSISKNTIEAASLLTGFTYNGTDAADAVTRDNYSWDTNDVINTGAGNDYVLAEAGDDQITGGTGNDELSGSQGNDTYYFNQGDGSDKISEAGVFNGYYDNYYNDNGLDKIQFGEGISKDDLIFFSPDSRAMEITFRNSPNDKITILNQLAGTTERIETLKFFDGSEIDLTDLNSVTFYMNGGEGSDSISGTKSKDVIDLGEGTNSASSGDGDDTITAGSGVDTINSGSGNDLINSGAGNDIITAEDGNDVINAGDGDDNIMPGDGDDVINAGKGNDVIGQRFFSSNNGWSGYIHGSNPGNDTYIYNIGDGSDTITEDNGNNNRDNGGLDKIKFGEGITVDDIYFITNGSDLTIKFKNNESDQITIYLYLSTSASGAKIETLEFADGSTVNLLDILKVSFEGTDETSNISASEYSDVINAKGGNDIIYSLGGDDVIDAGSGADAVYAGEGNDAITGGTDDDSLQGGMGDDTYIYNLGDGHDYLDDAGYLNQTSYGSDKIKFGAGIAKADLSFALSSGTLEIKIGSNENDKITIYNQYDYQARRIELIEFADGSTLDISNAANLEYNIYGDGGDNSIYASGYKDAISAGAGDDTVYAGWGNDQITGGTGNDNLFGEIGDDLYIYNAGDGADTINELARFNGRSLYQVPASDYLDENQGNDTIKFGEGISRSDITFAFEGTSLVVGFRNSSSDKITILNYSSGSTAHVENLKFADGSRIDISGLNSGNVASYDTSYMGVAATGDYAYSSGSGSRTIAMSDNSGQIIFGAGIAKDDVYFSISGANLLVKFRNNNVDQIVIDGHMVTSPTRVAALKFSDGSVVNISDPLFMQFEQSGTAGSDSLQGSNLNDVIYGNAGDDTISGGSGDDVIVGGNGDDSLRGYAGSDTYIFNIGDGKDSIGEYAKFSDGNDTIKFGEGITKDDIYLTRVDRALLIKFKNNNSDQITISQQFSSDGSKVENLVFSNGDQIDLADSTLAGSYVGSDGNDTILAQTGQDNIINAGKGDDAITGGYGTNDTFIFNIGDGKDVIVDSAIPTGLDRIKFGSGITKDMLTMKVVNNGWDTGFVINFKDHPSDQITILYYPVYRENYHGVKFLEFADGSTLDISDRSKIDLDETLNSPSTGGALDAGGGNDIVNGSQLDDIITGGTGDDLIYGWDGNDTYIFNIGDGKDRIGNGLGTDIGNDQILLGSGIAKEDVYFTAPAGTADLVINFRNNDTDRITLRGQMSGLVTDKIEILKFNNGDQINLTDANSFQINISGTDGTDNLSGTAYSDVINAGDGNDAIYGGGGDDIITGGKGDDSIYGGTGNDSYIFNIGDGKDTIRGEAGADKIIFGSGINKEDIYFEGSSQNLIIKFRNNDSDQISLNNHLASDSNKVELIQFDNGDTIDLQALDTVTFNGTAGDDYLYGDAVTFNKIIDAKAGNDTIYASAGNDILTGGLGNDTILGNAGNDTYIFNSGDGADTIYESSTSSSDSNGNDTIQLGVGILKTDIRFSVINDNVVINFRNSADQITIQNFLRSSADKIEKIQFSDGTSFDISALDSSNLDAYNYDYDNFVIPGNDYSYDLGAGELIISNASFSIDKILFGAGISADDVYLTRSQSYFDADLYIKFRNNSTDQIIVKNYFSSDIYKVEKLEFADGSSLNIADIGFEFTGTDGDDSIRTYGYSSSGYNSDSDVLVHAGAGNDQIDSSNGDDLLYGEDGDDSIITGNGNDIAYGGAGNDFIGSTDGNSQLYGEDGNDTLYAGMWSGEDYNNFADGGNGDDYLGGGNGADTLIGGEGNDQIYSRGGNDTIDAGNGGDQIYSDDGNDLISAGDGDDDIHGGEGDDVIDAGAGNDMIFGDAGNNILTGGAGSDRFRMQDGLTAVNTIKDFDLSASGDKIDLSYFSEAKFFSELNISQDGANAVIEIGSTKIILENIDSANLSSSNFKGLLKDGGYTINGSKFADSLQWDSYYNQTNGEILWKDSVKVYGKEGDDEIYSWSGKNNLLDGGLGDDKLISSNGSSTFIGGAGADKFVFSYAWQNGNFNNIITDFDVNNLSEKIILDAVGGVNSFADLSIIDSSNGAIVSYTALGLYGNSITNNITLNGVSASQLSANNFEIRSIVNGTADSDVVTVDDNTGHYFYGNGGNDVITSGSGDDNIQANEGNDVISSGAGNDFIYSVSGADNIDAGSGNDQIYLGGGNSVVHAGSGNDQINAWDYISSNQNEIYGESGDDQISISGEAQYQVSAGEGNDTIFSYSKFSTIAGDEGDDRINVAYSNNNEVSGGAGDDLITIDAASYANNISGGAGSDLFVVRDNYNNIYSGTNTITDFEINNSAEKIDFQFLNLEKFEDLQISQNGLDAVVTFSSDGGNFVLKNIDSTQLTAQNFIFKNNGTAGDDVVNANNKFNVVNTADGDDTITISGLENTISGGSGNDLFVIEKKGRSNTTIQDFEVENLNEKIRIKGFEEVREFSDLFFEYTEAYDANLGLTGKYNASTKLGDGQTLTITNVVKNSLTAANFEFRQNNTAPVAADDTVIAAEDAAITISFASILANDSDIEDGAAIQNLTGNDIVFTNPTNGTIVVTATGIIYTPNANYYGTDALTYQIKDSAGVLSNVATINLNIASVNDAPIVTSIIVPSSKINEDTVSVVVSAAAIAASFADVDGDSLTYSVSLISKGGVVSLPSWLSINSATGEIISTNPSNSDVGNYRLKITATDSSGAFASQDFVLAVNNVNDAPTINAIIANQSAKAGNSFAFTIPTNAFSDADGDNLTYSATLKNGVALPSWLVFDVDSRTFTGTPPSGAATELSLIITASDGPLSASQAIKITVDTNVISGTAKKDNLVGTSDNDEIYGNAGDDTINGGAGNDLITGGLGADKINGGNGIDTVSYADSTVAITVNLDTGKGSGGSAAGDTLTNIENIIGSSFNDTITGSAQNNILDGAAGNDVLKGGAGSDQLIGGAGKDTLTGGAGKDIFTFTSLSDSTINNSDLITDFTKGQDQIDFSGLGFASIIKGTSSADESILTYHYEGNNTIIEDHDHSFTVKLTGKIALGNGDFDFG